MNLNVKKIRNSEKFISAKVLLSQDNKVKSLEV